jgi:hypothetical protein
MMRFTSKKRPLQPWAVLRLKGKTLSLGNQYLMVSRKLYKLDKSMIFMEKIRRRFNNWRIARAGARSDQLWCELLLRYERTIVETLKCGGVSLNTEREQKTALNTVFEGLEQCVMDRPDIKSFAELLWLSVLEALPVATERVLDLRRKFHLRALVDEMRRRHQKSRGMLHAAYFLTVPPGRASAVAMPDEEYFELLEACGHFGSDLLARGLQIEVETCSAIKQADLAIPDVSNTVWRWLCGRQ